MQNHQASIPKALTDFGRSIIFALLIGGGSIVPVNAQSAPSAPSPTPATIWIEAEDAAATNFSPGICAMVKPDGTGASGGMYLALRTHSTPPAAAKPRYFAQYAFTTPRAGNYALWLAASPQSQRWCSPLSWQIDGASANDLSGAKPQSASWGEGDFCWTRGGTIELPAGPHTLRLEVAQPRESDKLWATFLDAILLTTDKGFIPHDNHRSLSPHTVWPEALGNGAFDAYRQRIEDEVYRKRLALTQENVSAQTSARVEQLIDARPLPNPNAPRSDNQVFGVHGMEMPFVSAGKDSDKVRRAYELLARVGVDSFRTAEGCWHRLGAHYDNFTQLDFQFENARRYGMTLGLTVGYPPDPYRVGPGLSAVKPEYEAMYRDYLHTLISRYRDQGIQYLELGNEVDATDTWWRGASTPEMYVHEAQMLREEADKVNPRLKTVAFAATYSRNDANGGPTGGRRFVRRCVELGIGKYADEYSLHYTWPTSERSFVSFFEDVAGSGPTAKPLITSEESAHGAPWDILKMFARDFYLCNMKRVDYFLAQDFYEAGRPIFLGLFDRDWNPKERLLPYALSVDAMKGRSLVGIAAPAKGVEAYVLRASDKNARARYSIVMWTNPLDGRDDASPVEPLSSRPAPGIAVAGVRIPTAAYRWNLETIPVTSTTTSFTISAEPTVVFANALPSWKLMSPKEWLALPPETSAAQSMRPPGL
ncbi:MAG: hypothetical protein P4L33_08540 [Capsulimonadaceae bacterium]|nr:hypothetical protein [Capsulimonadaceae bacterium]